MINVKINGKMMRLTCDPAKRLLDILCEDLGLTGPKEGCGEEECGACSVLIDGELTNSCLVAVGSLQGAEVVTIEGLRTTGRFEVLEQAFADAGAVQCGFCTPDMIIAAEALLERNAHPLDEEIRLGMSGNICRCTGYNMIAEAVRLAADRGNGLW